MSGKSWVSRPNRKPAATERAVPMIHVHMITRSVSIPVTIARSILSAMARIALPILV